jgi:hypothetical protein
MVNGEFFDGYQQVNTLDGAFSPFLGDARALIIVERYDIYFKSNESPGVGMEDAPARPSV